jgi:uncharacterized protein YjdB
MPFRKPAALTLALTLALAIVSASCGGSSGGGYVDVTHIAILPGELSMVVGGQPRTITAYIDPADATNKNVIWTVVPHDSVVNVEHDGLSATVTPVAAGKAIIRVITEDDGHTSTCSVTVVDDIPVEGVAISPTVLSLSTGGTADLAAIVLPANAANKNITWTNSDDGVALMVGGSYSAIVLALSPGTTTVTVTTEDGGHTAECAITVAARVPVEGVTVSPETLSMAPGDTATLAATVLPAEATNRNVTWFTSDGGVASIAPNGPNDPNDPNNLGAVVTAVAAGTATITVASVADPSRWAECQVTVAAVEPGTYVYVAGYEKDGGNRATVWKDGIPQHLSSEWSEANSVFVSGNDVYVAGFEDDGVTQAAMLWKNGVAQPMDSHIVAGAVAVQVSGGSVYAAGFDYNEAGGHRAATVWKDGVPQYISGEWSEVYSMHVVGSDVHCSGYEGGVARATVWKNGIATRLSDIPSIAHGIFVSGNDVYAVGDETISGDWNGRVWKNGGVLTQLGRYTTANAVYVSDGDVYVAGYARESGGVWVAKVWKNGSSLYVLSDANSDALSIQVVGGDVYVAGRESSDGWDNYATLWINGVAQPHLGDNGSWATSVFVDVK